MTADHDVDAGLTRSDTTGPAPEGLAAATPRWAERFPLWALASAATVAIAAVLGALALLAGNSLPDRNGPAIEQVAVERTVLRPGLIMLTVRNSGPDPVQIAQVSVNDVFVDVVGGRAQIGRLGTATLALDYPWQTGQPYLVSMLTSTGAVLDHVIPVAVTTPTSSRQVLGLMALLGIYVGVIPVLLGMLVLPVLRRAGPTVVQVLLALTVGLLAFLALDGGIAALQLGGRSGGAFGGPALVVLGAGLAFLALTLVDRILRGRRQRAKARGAQGLQLSLMVSVGIGLHNLGEGLAIGSAYAVGELALGAFLVVGFALHNTTEGIAIVAPLADGRASRLQLAGLGLLAGGPAVVGTMVGAVVINAELSALLIGVGVGAITQVIVQIAPALRARSGQLLHPASIGGISAGVLIMYFTGLLVTV